MNICHSTCDANLHATKKIRKRKKMVNIPENHLVKDLQNCYLSAFYLLAAIARYAKHIDDIHNPLGIAECVISDWKEYGLKSIYDYRKSIKILVNLNIIEKLETNRNRQKGRATGVNGTRVKLNNTGYYCTDHLYVNSPKTKNKKQKKKKVSKNFTNPLQPNFSSEKGKKKPTAHSEEIDEMFLPLASPSSNCPPSKRNNKENISPQKLSLSHKAKDLAASRSNEGISFNSNLEQDRIVLNAYFEDKSLNIKDFTLNRWLMKYDTNKIIDTYALMTQSQVRNAAGWMETALRENWALKEKNAIVNREFVIDLVNNKKLNFIEMNKKYCRDKHSGIEYYYKMSPEIFQRQILEKSLNSQL